eukprot:7378158-Prymnesium_polylepis.1
MQQKLLCFLLLAACRETNMHGHDQGKPDRTVKSTPRGDDRFRGRHAVAKPPIPAGAEHAHDLSTLQRRARRQLSRTGVTERNAPQPWKKN